MKKWRKNGKNGKFIKHTFFGLNETSKPNKIKGSSHIHRFIYFLITSALAYRLLELGCKKVNAIYNEDIKGAEEINQEIAAI